MQGGIDDGAPSQAQVQIEIAAAPAKVWGILIDARDWTGWQKSIDSVEVAGPLASDVKFSWKTGGTTIHSQVQLFEPEHRLAWTGTAMTAKAVHVWEIKGLAGGGTLVTVKESMDGLLMGKMFPSAKLAEVDREWLAALKVAAEK